MHINGFVYIPARRLVPAPFLNKLFRNAALSGSGVEGVPQLVQVMIRTNFFEYARQDVIAYVRERADREKFTQHRRNGYFAKLYRLSSALLCAFYRDPIFINYARFHFGTA